MKPRVLMIAYACDPQGSGEHWLGWGWAEQAAQSFEVGLITTPKARAAVEAASRPLGITPHFVDVPRAIRKLSELCGASWWRKLAWQKEVGRLAAVLHRQKPFAIVHQTTFHTFRSPFPAAGMGTPSVWGPVAGGEYVPPGFERYLGPGRWAESARQRINRYWLRFPAIRRSLAQTSVVFVSNRTTLAFLPQQIHTKCIVVPPNALRPEDEQWSVPVHAESQNRSAFRLLYVGNCVATRAIPIVFEALAQSQLGDYEFTIVGAGPALTHWQSLARQMGLDRKVRFAGRVPYQQLSAFYAQAGALAFPALRDSGGSALLEAMARNVPVICLDWAGPGEMVDEHSGVKIPVSNPAQTVPLFAAALKRLSSDAQYRQSLAAGARDRAKKLFRWEAKRTLLESTYRRLIQP